MNDYIELRIDASPCSEELTDLLAAFLADEGYESFVPDKTGLTAYVRQTDFNSTKVDELLECFPMDADFKVTSCIVEGKDWNEEWEKNYFKPIVISDRCVVHSSFHTDIPKAEYDIVIDPKMAFGTGHHATTTLMAQGILSSECEGRAVVDMGTGTGILAILCAMRGAAKVTAVEIDGFAIENARENIALNGVSSAVSAIHGDASALDALPEASQDIFLANINRNIITADIAAYARTLRSGGIMLLSGFYVADIPHIIEAASPLGLEQLSFDELDSWACLRLKKA